ncbi:MAG: hypothetical protein D6696_07210 [Acidobacteria bacterium]|nr:MAG: hypothetical protein D6696_07210 [Acidobacteriota bacterium]
MQEPRTIERIAEVLAATLAAALVLLLVAAAGWYRASHRPPRLSDLPDDQRQQLAAAMLNRSPGIYVATWFEPAIGYTLRPLSEIEAWNDRFTSNELGYRSGPVAKKPGTFRLLFVGDSWTYGMGVSRQEAYPAVVEEIARRQGVTPPVEAWTLALPGYNAVNQLAALWFFFDRLQPDAVVLAPTVNDHHSMLHVLPNGSLGPLFGGRDEFGHPHHLAYRLEHADSFRARSRLLRIARAMRDTEKRLLERGVPVVFFFIARWYPEEVHLLVRGAGIESPYLVVPVRLTVGERWTNPDIDHGNRAANRVYGEGLYRGLARRLGWPPLAPPDDPQLAIPYFDRPSLEPNHLWQRRRQRLQQGYNRRNLASDWQPGGKDRWRQVAGPMNAATGAMGHATTILLRRRAGSSRLRVTVARFDALPSLYPLRLTARIPAGGGGTQATTTVPADGPPQHRFTLPVPDDVAPGTALDLELIAERAAAEPPDGKAPRSVRVLSVEQLD